MSGKKNRKKINKQKRRQIAAAVIAIILALAMVVPLLVMTVSAAESGTIAGAVQTAGDVVQDGITLEGVDLSGRTFRRLQIPFWRAGRMRPSRCTGIPMMRR